MSGVDVIARSLARSAASRAAVAAAAVPVYNRAGLAGWHAALANRASAPAKAIFFGDSITEGVAVATHGQRWVDRALARLRLDHPTPGVAGGFNFLPPLSIAANSGAGTPQPYTALTGNAPGNENGRGLAGRCAVFHQAVGDGATYGFTGTSVTAIYDKAPGLDTISMAIDGGAAITASTMGTNGTIGTLASGALTAGAHTVTITRSAGGSVFFSGLIVNNGDEAAGVHGYEGGHFAWTAASFTGDATWRMVPTLIAPQLMTLAIGTNDYGLQASPATFRANLVAAVANFRLIAPAASIALIAYSRRGDMAVGAIGWDQYVRAMYEVADADTGGINGASGVAVIDLSMRLPNAALTGTADPLGMYSADRVHFTAKGHAAIGEYVGRALGM